MRRESVAPHLEADLRAALQAPHLRLVNLSGERPSSDRLREPWIDYKYDPQSPDDWFGVVPATAQFERAAGKGIEILDLIVKVNPR